MLTLLGLIGLIAYILVRPFDFFPQLASIPFLYAFFAVAVLGFLFDLARRNIRWAAGPHLPWVVVLTIWTLVSALLHASGDPMPVRLIVSPALYFLIAHGIGDFRSFSRFVAVFLGCTLTVSAVCVYQGLQPTQCIAFADAADAGDPAIQDGTPDGHACSEPADCYDDPPLPEIKYTCEHVGPGEIRSIQGRVRYVGVLSDPNEASMVICLGVPIAICFYQRRRSFARLVGMGVTVVLAAVAVVMSQSRGGQLVFVTVLGVYLISRYRWRGILVGLVLSIPVLLYGGRNDASAEESKLGRLGVQRDGIEMFIHSPVSGVGYGQYVTHSSGTAHDSFVLTPAELGLIGMATWMMVFWLSFKIVLTALKVCADDKDREAATWGMAVLAMLSGLAVGVAFLSFNYHYVLWTVFGVAGAYHRSVLTRHPEATVRGTFRDLVLVTGGNLALLAFIYTYTSIKGIQ
jgi:O-Antigen ligase